MLEKLITESSLRVQRRRRAVRARHMCGVVCHRCLCVISNNDTPSRRHRGAFHLAG